MNKKLTSLFSVGCTIVMAALSSCTYTEDPGPLQEDERLFPIIDFDRLELGSAFIITVEQGDFFSVMARGDRRNLNDIIAEIKGSTLTMRYRNDHGRRHDTYITITMPTLRSANFSGASNTTIYGFYDQENFDCYLSGASLLQTDIEADNVSLVISGASDLTLNGAGSLLDIEISGASKLNAFNYPADQVNIVASGASKAKVRAVDVLDARASGASVIYYRGEPTTIHTETSGASTVQKD